MGPADAAARPRTSPGGTRPTPARASAGPATDPWSRPWTGPTKEDARRVFAAEAAEAARELRRIEERRTALREAVAGRDYPYSYPGAPFPLASCAGVAEAVAA